MQGASGDVCNFGSFLVQSFVAGQVRLRVALHGPRGPSDCLLKENEAGNRCSLRESVLRKGRRRCLFRSPLSERHFQRFTLAMLVAQMAVSLHAQRPAILVSKPA
jgi:hypothetical protein